MKTFLFTIILQGSGNDMDEAWNDAVENFSLDPGAIPDNFEEIEDDE